MSTQHYYFTLWLSLYAGFVLLSAVGGDEKSHKVSAASTTFTIHNLRESSAYKIQVSSMVGNREGSPVLVTARTCESCLRYTMVSDRELVLADILNWDIEISI